MDPRIFDPLGFGFEMLYSVIVISLFALVYYKTKDIYKLTKHKGIHYFRIAFLLFGAAYAARFLFHIIQLSLIAFDVFMPRGIPGPLAMLLTGYLSTLAIFYLAYSTVWKRYKHPAFMLFSNSVAVIISLVAWLTRSPLTLALVQLPLIIFTLSQKKKNQHTRALYFLIILFWIMNIFVLGPRWFLPPEIKVVLQTISLGVFIFLYHKVSRWTG